MAYTPFGYPNWTDDAPPGIQAAFLNALELFLTTINSAATDNNVSATAGKVSLVSLAPTSAVTVAGTTAGNATLYQFIQGTVKHCIVYFAGYRNSTATEQRLTLPTAFTNVANFKVGATPTMHVWQSGSQLTNKCELVSALSGAGPGTSTTGSNIYGFGFGDITSGFDQIGLGVSQGQTFTAIAEFIGV